MKKKQCHCDKYLRWRSFSKKKGNKLYIYVKMLGGLCSIKTIAICEAFTINSPDIFEEIVCEFSRLNTISSDGDVNYDAVNTFCLSRNQSKDLGDHFTPINITRTIIDMVNPKIDEKIYNQHCEAGGFVIGAFRYLKIITAFNEERNFLEKINKLNLMKKEFNEIENNAQDSMQQFLP